MGSTAAKETGAATCSVLKSLLVGEISEGGMGNSSKSLERLSLI